MTRASQPRFKPGDRVVIAHGHGHVWTVVREETAPWESEPAYALEDGRKQRYAGESALEHDAGEDQRS